MQAEIVYLLVNFVLSFLGFLTVVFIIPHAIPSFLKARLFGKDLNKSSLTDEKIPESLGIIPATVYLLIVIIWQLFLNDTNLLSRYTAAILSICLMTFLGFADDVLNLRWRYKLFLPAIASLPIVVSYTGSTLVVVPKPLRALLLCSSFDLGYIYLVYLVLLLLFCSNSINIYAGINGLEVGQSIIISLVMIAYNILHLFTKDNSIKDSHFLALSLLLPFTSSSLGLFHWNKFPSRVFVGDSYTYFAGVTLGVAAIVGQFTKLLLLLFIPQLINFVYSLPQLTGFVPCPRHRLPKFNEKTKKLEGVKSHMNLINLVLRFFGSMTENNLFVILMILQTVCSTLGLVIRELLASRKILYD
ncbi:hypothetical protein P9112_008390 [Eukaryota sp. TZLM1-RC]